MNYNILIGGSAGQGVETVSAIFEKILKRQGFKIFTIKDYMSRVRGGHNFIQVRFGTEKLFSHRDEIDGIMAFNDETIELHLERLKSDGFIICDEEINFTDQRILKLPLKQTAKASGNIKAFGSVAVGSVLELLGIGQTGIENVLMEYFNSEISAQNLNAIHNGRKLVSKRCDTVPSKKDGNILINGNQAVALGALAAGCRFYSAYPMTPSTSIMNYLAEKMMDAEIVVEQAEDEIAAINMAIGASYAGARSMTGTSGGGFSLMVEALGLSGMMEIPLVIAEVQRPGPTTGFPTRTEQSDLKFVISASQGEFPRMVIALRNAEDAFYQTVRAFDIADKYQLPVILLSDQFLADSTVTSEPFDFESTKINNHICEYSSDKPYNRYEITPTGISPRLIPGGNHGITVLSDSDEHDKSGHITESADIRNQMVNKRMRKLDLLKEELQEPLFIGAEDSEVLLLAWGSLWGPVSEAVNILNEYGDSRYGALVFGDIWPLPVKLLAEKAKKAKRIINVEQNATGQLASIVSEVTGIFCDSSILKFDGRPMSSGYICSKIRGE
ncbi:MAG: 2-oxoacid:acceptor oxidoreductase subunit alpha [Bacillota bacterium]|nr:2-oxoacid:acceptor oxidoreductase subunit alpha [Bacillota bacterium]